MSLSLDQLLLITKLKGRNNNLDKFAVVCLLLPFVYLSASNNIFRHCDKCDVS